MASYHQTRAYQTHTGVEDSVIVFSRSPVSPSPSPTSIQLADQHALAFLAFALNRPFIRRRGIRISTVPVPEEHDAQVACARYAQRIVGYTDATTFVALKLELMT